MSPSIVRSNVVYGSTSEIVPVLGWFYQLCIWISIPSGFDDSLSVLLWVVRSGCRRLSVKVPLRYLPCAHCSDDQATLHLKYASKVQNLFSVPLCRLKLSRSDTMEPVPSLSLFPTVKGLFHVQEGDGTDMQKKVTFCFCATSWSFIDPAKRLADMLQEKLHLPAALQSLGCTAEAAMPVSETRENEVEEFIKENI
ncbi:hypothetical protein BUALT_Bualt01G0014700 [Buddleja alternifolia]|uniref:Uncharacterized protein n=1 Tax=Buddleja alternifolia TaxID=168488 RepID=A0AAV6Y3P3_9LAMI|nr:hypothetical protein BUALT_Bualt01G0014700 [Buddleja alternifolia]